MKPMRDAEPGYDHSKAALTADQTLVLKHAETFTLFDRYGDVLAGEQGIYHDGMRFVSRLGLTINGERPRLLGSAVHEDNLLLSVDLTHPVRTDTVHLRRSRFLWQGACHERITLTNFGTHPASFCLEVKIEADFRDLFEVRGQHREARGTLHEPVINLHGMSISYTGLDDIERTSRVTANPPADEITADQLRFDLMLDPQAEETLEITFACEAGADSSVLTFYSAYSAARQGRQRKLNGCVRIESSNALFDQWMHRSLEDLHMLTTETPAGLYPYAGIPWFSTAFGRDGIITALQTLWVNPRIARGVLRYLAETQATEFDPAGDAEPGKILHETRGGEMAALGEIPFGMYYGSVDSTPLFVVLAGRYYAACADRDLIASIWPNIEAALEWIDRYGDLDGDGFVEYQRKEDAGLLHQGWKDSHDSVFHVDGTPASLPIAICEMQAYVYAAWKAAARLADVLGHHERATELRRKAEKLQAAFEAHFWDEDLGTYVIALDGDKRPCRVASSNAGHTLLSGIASPERAAMVARRLLAEDSFSGWGIRTVATSTSRYNPMSYHNGSIWPHDNALIADGMARYGHQDMAAQVMTAMFDASRYMENHRMPELFCGFPRRQGEGPTLYPVACSPQAWAAGSVFMFLSACLGMSSDAPGRRLRFTRPMLPEYLDEVRISNLRIGESRLDLALHRHPDDVGINVLRRSGPVEVIVVK